ncbi:MAG: cytochrome P450 [Alphaproteobacteria bacterium]|nr:cytochrome P450 [Alphaproteobacteria bacterium]
MLIPPYPVPHRNKAQLLKRFLTGWKSSIHTLFEKSYTMKMGEIHFPKLDFFIANELSIVEEVMNDGQHAYPKHALQTEFLGPLIGNSVFSANGLDWEYQRTMLNPAFAQTSLKRVFPVMKAAVDDLIDHILKQDLSRPVAIEPLMTHIAADIIFRTIFSIRLDADGSSQIYQAFHNFQRYIQPSAMLRIYGLPMFGYKRRAAHAAKLIHAVFKPIIQMRYEAYRSQGEVGPSDIMHMLLETRHPETGAPFSFDEIMDQVSMIFLAGHETSASALSWALYLLAECPHLQQELAGEIGPDPIGFETIKRAQKLRNMFSETLRLYPPVSFFLRQVTRPTEMRGKKMNPGDMIAISPWLIQRNKDNFPCPHGFDPGRFSDPEQAEACRNAYLPFGKGPRMCIGAGFAQQEAMLVLGSMVQKFQLIYPQGPKPQPVNKVTLRSEKGISLMLSPHN